MGEYDWMLGREGGVIFGSFTSMESDDAGNAACKSVSAVLAGFFEASMSKDHCTVLFLPLSRKS